MSQSTHPKIETAEDLRTRVSEGWTFYVPPFILEDSVVTNPDANLDEVRGDSRFELSDESWAFESKDADGTEWFHYVEPTDGGPNNGVVKSFWRDSEGELAGHHESYPRGFNEVTDI